MKIATILTLLLATASCATAYKGPPLPTVMQVDLQRYAGKWYEIARLPNSFQKGCIETTAEYALQVDGSVRVRNECREESSDGEVNSADGTAWVVDHQTNAKLKVQFFWPFSGDYWILALGDQYDYAMVGDPSRRYLWILSRAPELSAETFAKLVDLASNHGFPVKELLVTKQGLTKDGSK